MGGIRARNLFEDSILANQLQAGCPILIPPNDEQFVVASTALADTTADADFTLAAPIAALGNRFPWPIRLFVVLRNRATIGTGPPGITQSNTQFSGNDQFEVKITGKFRGRVRTETLTVNFAALTTPAGLQRQHMVSNLHYDEITSIRHQNKSGDFGRVTPLQVSVGTANCEFGDAAPSRLSVYYPFKAADTALVKRLMYLDDNTSAAYGTTVNDFDILNGSSTMRLPGKAPRFTRNAGMFSVQLAAETFTKVGHGLTNGMTVRLEASPTDGLPSGVAEDTTYYVVGAAADTLQLALTPGGAAILLAAAAPFADGEFVRILRPQHEWRRAQIVYADGLHVEGI